MDDFEKKYGVSLEKSLRMSNDELLKLSKSTKKASVVKRGVAGGIIAGPAGAVVGALSAVDKNSRNK